MTQSISTSSVSPAMPLSPNSEQNQEISADFKAAVTKILYCATPLMLYRQDPTIHLKDFSKEYANLLKTLTHVDFSRIALTNVQLRALLVHCTTLNALKVGHYSCGSDLSFLDGLSTLETLDVSGCENLVDISDIRHCPKLNTFNLGGCVKVIDISPLRAHRSIKHLNIQSIPDLIDIGPLKHVPKLKELIMSYCKKVTDLTPLENHESLEILNLEDSGAVTLFPLESCEKLKSLNARGLGGFISRISIPESLQKRCTIERTSPMEAIANILPAIHIPEHDSWTFSKKVVESLPDQGREVRSFVRWDEEKNYNSDED